MSLLQTVGGKDESNIVLCGNRNEHHNKKLRPKKLIIGQQQKNYKDEQHGPHQNNFTVMVINSTKINKTDNHLSSRDI